MSQRSRRRAPLSDPHKDDRATVRTREVPDPPRLHIGCGREHFPGWLNLDVQDLPGVDLVVDVTRGLHFSGVEAVFAEHFLEHLDLEDALAFLSDVQNCLASDGLLRLSTPNLDWVWETHYSTLAKDPAAKQIDGLRLNRAFHGWRHRFLWNRPLLEEALGSCGFVSLNWCGYGESSHPVFRGVEQHATYEDRPDLPHVLIVEAKKGPVQAERREAFSQLLRAEFLSFLED